MSTLPELSPGLSASLQHLVDDRSTARHLGSGTVGVLATPELVRLMEAAAVTALAGHLTPDITSVGVAIDMQHVAPTPVGLKVEICATLTEVQGRRLTFEVTARDDVEEIGRGIHRRVLVEVEGFEARARAKSSRAT
jgi:predicted thioesterase